MPELTAQAKLTKSKRKAFTVVFILILASLLVVVFLGDDIWQRTGAAIVAIAGGYFLGIMRSLHAVEKIYRELMDTLTASLKKFQRTGEVTETIRRLIDITEQLKIHFRL